MSCTRRCTVQGHVVRVMVSYIFSTYFFLIWIRGLRTMDLVSCLSKTPWWKLVISLYWASQIKLTWLNLAFMFSFNQSCNWICIWQGKGILWHKSNMQLARDNSIMVNLNLYDSVFYVTYCKTITSDAYCVNLSKFWGDFFPFPNWGSKNTHCHMLHSLFFPLRQVCHFGLNK